jgi:hypothetical protein
VVDARVYLIDRAGPQANAFADKLAGRQGVQLVGGAADVEEALEDITEAELDVILVGTDVGGAGVVAAVERVLSVAGDVAVVALCTRADKALVSAAIRAGAAGSLDRTASDIDTITALLTYRDRQRGEQVDMRLAEPPSERRSLRVSGALPRFPTPIEEVSYLNEQPLIGAIEMAEDVQAEPDLEAEPEPVAEAPVLTDASEPPPSAVAPEAQPAAEYAPPPEQLPEPAEMPQPEYAPPPEYTPPPEYAPAPDPTPEPESTPSEPAMPDPWAQPETTSLPEAVGEASGAPRSEPMPAFQPAPEALPEDAPVETPVLEAPAAIDDDLQEMREMLRGEAAAAASKAPKRKIGGLFGRRLEKLEKKQEKLDRKLEKKLAKKTPWGPQGGSDDGAQPGVDEETESN